MLPENLGVAKGYNRAMALVTGTHMVITGCDMIMPQGWLRHMVDALSFEDCGMSLMYSDPIYKNTERQRGPEFHHNKLIMCHALPIGRRLMSVEVQREIGYFHEGLGLYGWDDVLWAARAEKVLFRMDKKYPS